MPNRTDIRVLVTITAILLLLPGVGGAEGLPPLTHKLTAVTKETRAPILRLQNMDEETVDTGKLRGKVLVVNFWASWCPPCRREMGSLERLHKVTMDKGVEILAVNIGEDMDTVFSFQGTVDPWPEFTILFDPDGASMEEWGVKGLPTTFVVDRNGFVVFRAVGGREFDHPEIQRVVLELSEGATGSP